MIDREGANLLFGMNFDATCMKRNIPHAPSPRSATDHEQENCTMYNIVLTKNTTGHFFFRFFFKKNRNHDE